MSESEKEFRVRLLKHHYVFGENVTKLAENSGASREAVYANMLNAAKDHAAEHYNWLRAALTALAKRKLKEANETRENENDWPAGQEWEDLAGSSQSIFFRQACEEADVPRDLILESDRIVLYAED